MKRFKYFYESLITHAYLQTGFLLPKEYEMTMNTDGERLTTTLSDYLLFDYENQKSYHYTFDLNGQRILTTDNYKVTEVRTEEDITKVVGRLHLRIIEPLDFFKPISYTDMVKSILLATTLYKPDVKHFNESPLLTKILFHAHCNGLKFIDCERLYEIEFNPLDPFRFSLTGATHLFVMWDNTILIINPNAPNWFLYDARVDGLHAMSTLNKEEVAERFYDVKHVFGYIFNPAEDKKFYREWVERACTVIYHYFTEGESQLCPR